MMATVIDRKIENIGYLDNCLDRGRNIYETLRAEGIVVAPHSNCWNIVPRGDGVFLAAFSNHEPDRMIARFGEMSVDQLKWALDHPPDNPGLIVLLLRCSDYEKTNYAEVFKLLDAQSQARGFPFVAVTRSQSTENAIRRMESDIHARMDELGRRPN